MADNAFVKIGTALLKHQVKKLVGEETLGVLSEELADIGGDKLDAWLGDKSTIEQIEQAATYAQDCFHDSVGDHELEQWMISLPIGNLPKVLDAVEKLPTSPDEKQLENALRNAIADWRKISPEQINKAVNAFMSCLRSALLPIEKQTLMVIGRSVLRTEDKVDLLLRWFEQYIITGKSVEIKQLNPEPVETWNLKHPYAMPPNFTGRVDERKMLTDWLNKDNENHLFIMRALGGFGKSALSWHWLTHDVDSQEWKKVLWWSFYEGDASFEHFIEETLKYLNLDVPQGQRPQVDELLKAMQSQKILLIMDGFERALRAYSSMNAAYQGDDAEESPSPASGRGDRGEGGLNCVNINAEIFLKHLCSLPNIQSKVLMTTRLSPRAVKPRGEFMLGCREVELTSMQPADAVEFFHKQKIKGTHAEIETACAPYGYHPLSLRLLAGRILKDFENPADIVVAQKLKIDGDIIQQKHHVLEVSYNSLSEQEQKLLSTISCFRSPVELDTLKAIAESKETLEDELHDLVDRGLLHHDKENKKFDLHPIVRHYAYDHFTDEKRRKEVHAQLATHFINTIAVTNTRVMALGDLAPTIELYYHLTCAEHYEIAFKLLNSRLVPNPLHYEFAAYQLIIELVEALFPNGNIELTGIKDSAIHAWLYLALANSYSLNGQPSHAASLYEMHNISREKVGDKMNFAVGLGAMAHVLLFIGALREAERNLRHGVELSTEVNDKHSLSNEHRELGKVLTKRGIWQASEENFEKAFEYAKEISHIQDQGTTLAYRAMRFQLMAREKAIFDNRKSSNEYWQSAIESAQRALELVDKQAKSIPVPIDYTRAYWLLGAAYRANGDSTKAEENLSKAISICRQINIIIFEADILLDLARLRYDQKNYEEAKSLADEALTITERCGYVLQGADVNLFLAQYALEQEKDKAKAKEYAKEALKLATCDGPPYYYKVAYEEAEKFLKDLGG